MKRACIVLALTLTALKAQAGVSCDGVFRSADGTITAQHTDAGFVVDGQVVHLMPCGSGLYCSYVEKDGERVSTRIAYLDVGTVFPAEVHYRHRTLGEIILRDTCHDDGKPEPEFRDLTKE